MTHHHKLNPVGTEQAGVRSLQIHKMAAHVSLISFIQLKYRCAIHCYLVKRCGPRRWKDVKMNHQSIIINITVIFFKGKLHCCFNWVQHFVRTLSYKVALKWFASQVEFCGLLLELSSEDMSNTFLGLSLWLKVYFRAAPILLGLELRVIVRKKLSLSEPQHWLRHPRTKAPTVYSWVGKHSDCCVQSLLRWMALTQWQGTDSGGGLSISLTRQLDGLIQQCNAD